jgi:hypothetical protein
VGNGDPNAQQMQFFFPVNPTTGVAGGAAAGSAAAAGGLQRDPNTGLLIPPKLDSIEDLVARSPTLSLLYGAYRLVQTAVDTTVGGFGAGQQPSPGGPMVNVPIAPDRSGGNTSSPMTDPSPGGQIAGEGFGSGGVPNYGGPTGMPNNGSNAGLLGWIIMNSQGTNGSPAGSSTSTPQSIDDIKGTTVFTQPSQGQRISGENAGVRLGPWGEGPNLAGGLLNQLSPGGRSIQNASGNGADYIGGTIDHVGMTIPGFEVKATDTGNRQPVGDLPVRMKDWIDEAANFQTVAGKPISASDQAYATYLSGLLQQGYTIKPYVVEVAVPAQGQTGRPTIQVTPWPVPRGTSRPRIAPP